MQQMDFDAVFFLGNSKLAEPDFGYFYIEPYFMLLLNIFVVYLSINIVMVTIPTSKVKNGVANFFAVLTSECSLLEESAERRQTSPGPNHQNRGLSL